MKIYSWNINQFLGTLDIREYENRKELDSLLEQIRDKVLKLVQNEIELLNLSEDDLIVLHEVPLSFIMDSFNVEKYKIISWKNINEEDSLKYQIYKNPVISSMAVCLKTSTWKYDEDAFYKIWGNDTLLHFSYEPNNYFSFTNRLLPITNDSEKFIFIHMPIKYKKDTEEICDTLNRIFDCNDKYHILGDLNANIYEEPKEQAAKFVWSLAYSENAKFCDLGKVGGMTTQFKKDGTRIDYVLLNKDTDLYKKNVGKMEFINRKYYEVKNGLISDHSLVGVFLDL